MVLLPRYAHLNRAHHASRLAMRTRVGRLNSFVLCRLKTKGTLRATIIKFVRPF